MIPGTGESAWCVAARPDNPDVAAMRLATLTRTALRSRAAGHWGIAFLPANRSAACRATSMIGDAATTCSANPWALQARHLLPLTRAAGIIRFTLYWRPG